VSTSRLAPGEIAILIATRCSAWGKVHGGALTRLQLGGCSRLAVFDKPGRSVSAGCAAMAPSGNAAPTASAATFFMSIDAFIVSFFPTPHLLGTVPARTFSFACASFGGRD
jgi:hypothetical protein